MAKFSLAIEDFTKCLEFDDYNQDYYFMRAEAQMKAGQKTGACLDYKRALENGHDEADARIEQYCK